MASRDYTTFNKWIWCQNSYVHGIRGGCRRVCCGGHKICCDLCPAGHTSDCDALKAQFGQEKAPPPILPLSLEHLPDASSTPPTSASITSSTPPTSALTTSIKSKSPAPHAVAKGKALPSPMFLTVDEALEHTPSRFAQMDTLRQAFDRLQEQFTTLQEQFTTFQEHLKCSHLQMVKSSQRFDEDADRIYQLEQMVEELYKRTAKRPSASDVGMGLLCDS